MEKLNNKIYIDNLNKSIYIYSIMMGIALLFFRGRGISESDGLKLLIIEPIVMIILFRVFKMNDRGIKIFLAIFTVLLMMIAINSKALFNEYYEIGVYVIKPIIPFEILAIISIISAPLGSIFIVLKNCGVIYQSIYIIPIYMFVLTYISIKLSKLKLYWRR